MQSPPTRTNKLVRVGGLCNISHDFNRRRYIDSNLGYLVSLSSAFSIFLAIAGPGLEVSALCILFASAEP
jgi:hypothetical protein